MKRIKIFPLILFLAFLGCIEEDTASRGLLNDPSHYGSNVDETGLVRVSIEVVEAGIYDLKYQCCLVNNSSDETFNILAQANLFINNDGAYLYQDAVKSKGFNVSSAAHYGVLTLLWAGYLLEGDIVEIQVIVGDQGVLPGEAIIIDVQPEGFAPNVWETFIMYRIDAPNTQETIFLVK